MESGILRWALCTALVCTLLSGCGMLRNGTTVKADGPRLARTLARLPALELGPAAATPVIADELEVLAAYRAVYGQVPDAAQNQQLGKRLADLEMVRAEELNADGVHQAPYADAVTLYESLLAQADPDAPQDPLLYQLAQAYDLSGDGERALHNLDRLIADYPTSELLTEAHFRRAEMHFSAGRFDLAAADYAAVKAAGNDTSYWLHASYMLGWSQFKESELDSAADQFYAVIDTASSDAGEGPSAGRELLNDTLRVLMLTLEYADGATTLAADMRERGQPQWQYLVYERLATEYLAQERFLDGVAAWQTFVDENPLDARAPQAQIGVIDTLAAADFPSDIPPKKAAFVAAYGVRSEFWQVHDAAAREGYAPQLQSYLGELSKSAHAQAQTSRKPDDYLAAADWYEQIVETFPDDPTTGDVLFLLGDAYTEAGRAASALAAYQRVVSDYPEHPQAAEAGYASILALTELTAAKEPTQPWAAHLLQAQIDFAMIFASDPRAPSVQAAAADTLFQADDYAQAIELASHLLDSRPQLDAELRNTALLILGHGNLELGHYVAAENAYGRYLKRNASHSGKRATREQRDALAGVAQRRLASVYKQAELAEGNGDVAVALKHYLRIAEIDPASKLAAGAHFDAIAMLETAGDLPGATGLLTSFRQRYPADKRTADVPGRLAGMLEAQHAYSAAADEYLKIAATKGGNAEQLERSRQAHFLAAELFLKDGAKERALQEFNNYSDRYRKPFDLNMEALQTQETLLDELRRDASNVWQRKVQLVAAAGAASTERMTFLAAQAQLALADVDRQSFVDIRLEQPLRRSLKKKQRALRAGIDAYEKVAGYGVAEFTTAATFQIAGMYQVLSTAIMDSERPRNLSALELAQYDILLEEQAYPFEEQAIALHEVNLQRMWRGTHDAWIDQSLAALKTLMPGRFDKDELQVAYVHVIH